jgi:uncharacterized protein YjiS (DUF1127 family)
MSGLVYGRYDSRSAREPEQLALTNELGGCAHERRPAGSREAGRFGTAIITARRIISEWRRRHRLRRELITLSDTDLRDIRWTRAEATAEGNKPFWRA